MRIKNLFMGFALITLVGCLDDDKKQTESNGVEGNIDRVIGVTDELNGVWYTPDCEVHEFTSETTSLTIKDAEWEYYVNVYSDSDCDDPLAYFNLERTAIMIEEDTLTDGTAVKNADFITTKFSKTIMKDWLTDNHNDSAYCGITTWKTGIATDMSHCFKNSAGILAVGTYKYNIYQMEYDTLYTGDLGDTSPESDGKTPETRYNALNYDRRFVKYAQ